MSRLRLAMDPTPQAPGSSWTADSRRELAACVTSFRAMFVAGDFGAAASWAGQIAVMLENRDDQRALSWWQRERWLRVRIEAWWDGTCDRDGCITAATTVLYDERHPEAIITYCDRHAAEAVTTS